MKDLHSRRGVNKADFHVIRRFVKLNGNFIENIDEQLYMTGVTESMTIWTTRSGKLAGLYFVDPYQNFWFQTSPEWKTDDFLTVALPLALAQARERFDSPGLDACEPADSPRLEGLLHAGFVRTGLETLYYELDAGDWNCTFQIPDGFTLRPVKGMDEIPAVVKLMRSAHGDDQFSDDERQAMMECLSYIPDLDLVLVDEHGDLAANCVCEILEEGGIKRGYTDPIVVRDDLKGRGLGKAILCAGISGLISLGMKQIRLGTSSENTAMQRLAEAVGFREISRKVWLNLQDPSNQRNG